jgi:hypothetical protein
VQRRQSALLALYPATQKLRASAEEKRYPTENTCSIPRSPLPSGLEGLPPQSLLKERSQTRQRFGHLVRHALRVVGLLGDALLTGRAAERPDDATSGTLAVAGRRAMALGHRRRGGRGWWRHVIIEALPEESGLLDAIEVGRAAHITGDAATSALAKRGGGARWR